MDALIPEFVSFSKIPRIGTLYMLVTEKLDGTNGLIHVSEEGQVQAGSRNRWLQPESDGVKGSDNYGFASWVRQNQEALKTLGPGYHYGEWYGCGIGRGYDLHERRFALFNPDRYRALDFSALPFSVVPILHRGPVSTAVVDWCLEKLEGAGSSAVPGFMRPEGLVVRLGDRMFKAILDKRGPSPIETP